MDIETGAGCLAKPGLLLVTIILLTPTLCEASPGIGFHPTSVSTWVTPNEKVSAFIVLRNNLSEELHLSEWRVTGVGTNLAFPPPEVLPPGGERVVQINFDASNLLGGEYYSEVYIHYRQARHGQTGETGLGWEQGLVVVVPCFFEVVSRGRSVGGVPGLELSTRRVRLTPAGEAGIVLGNTSEERLRLGYVLRGCVVDRVTILGAPTSVGPGGSGVIRLVAKPGWSGGCNGLLEVVVPGFGVETVDIRVGASNRCENGLWCFLRGFLASWLGGAWFVGWGEG
ncbi:MAG: hypothetical protein DRO11_03650 [Methanobacteriota archaeon]|nr:MAG: hypothetical protein DRO11_03650 [Euryarchaeota archaeon]